MKTYHRIAGALVALLASAALAQDFTYYPQGYGNQTRPEIGANFGQQLRTETIRFYIDDKDVTALAEVHDNRVVFRPNYDIDQGAHTAQVRAVDRNGNDFQRSWGFSVNQGGQTNPPDNSNVTQLTPMPGNGSDNGLRPEIGVVMPAGLNPINYSLTIDGRDFTKMASINGNRLSVVPDYDLDRGQHNVYFSGFSNGERLEQRWNFYVR